MAAAVAARKHALRMREKEERALKSRKAKAAKDLKKQGCVQRAAAADTTPARLTADERSTRGGARTHGGCPCGRRSLPRCAAAAAAGSWLAHAASASLE